MAAKQKIRIKLKAYDTNLLDQAAGKIVEIARRTGAEVGGPIPLPIKHEVYCVIRGPHVDKESREHFEIRTHKRMIDILRYTQETVDALTNQFELPAGVDAVIKFS